VTPPIKNHCFKADCFCDRAQCFLFVEGNLLKDGTGTNVTHTPTAACRCAWNVLHDTVLCLKNSAVGLRYTSGRIRKLFLVFVSFQQRFVISRYGYIALSNARRKMYNERTGSLLI